MVCPSCAEEAPDDAKWCEACGHDLNVEPLPMCVSCGEREVGEDGYCLSCGHKQPEERDHLTFHDGATVAVTDRGKRHRHNEDAVAIGTTDAGAAVLVVCDGVSSTPGSAEASLRAAGTARDLLLSGLADDVVEIDTLLNKAVEAAQAEASASTEVESNAPHATGGPPSSTFVAVVIRPGVGDGDTTELSTAWVGDSRAYWVGDEPQRLSPVDHELGGSLVRWLGADSIDPTPDLATVEVSGTGSVVVCSDGLWRYAAEPTELHELVERVAADGGRGLGLAGAMVDFANEQGGHDNISVALWTNHPDRLEPAPDADPEPVATPEPPARPEPEAAADPTDEPADEPGRDESTSND